MKLLLERKFKKEKYTIGDLYIDSVWFCNTIEDTDRGLNDNMTLEEIKKNKIYAETAIPTGTYKITLNIVSPKFSKKKFYKDFCNGKLPRLLNVKGFDGILIHIGSNERQSAGCILVGENKIKLKIL